MNLAEIKNILGLLEVEPKSHGWYQAHLNQIKGYPLFISFPRTGAHWLNAVMELYLDRPRLPAERSTFLDVSRNDWLFFHDHDTIAYDKLYIENQESLYLYRDPIPTVFSYIIYNFNNGNSLSFLDSDRLKKLVTASAHHYRNHLLKWLVDKPAKTIIKHENFKTDAVEEFSKVCKHFGTEVNEDRIKECFSTVTPSALTARRAVYFDSQGNPWTDANALSDFMLTDEYRKERDDFTFKFGEEIKSIVVSGKLQEWF